MGPSLVPSPPAAHCPKSRVLVDIQSPLDIGLNAKRLNPYPLQLGNSKFIAAQKAELGGFSLLREPSPCRMWARVRMVMMMIISWRILWEVMKSVCVVLVQQSCGSLPLTFHRGSVGAWYELYCVC